jgi:WD40 repeat protein
MEAHLMKYRRHRKAGSAPARRLSDRVLFFVVSAALALAPALLTPPRPASAASAPDLAWMRGGRAGGFGKAALSPDGQTLATANGAEILLWRYADGQLVGVIDAPWIDSVKSVKFTPDGQYVVAGGTWIPGSSGKSTLRMWRVADRSPVRDFAVTWDVKSVALSSDGTQLAAAVGGGDPSVILFDVATGAQVLTLGHFAANCVAFSPDGFVAATGADRFGDPPTVNVWHAPDGLVVAKLTGLSFISDTVAFSPDGRYLAAGDWGGNGLSPKVLVWLAPAFAPVRSFTPYDGSGGQIAFTPDSQSLATFSGPTGVAVWHLPDGLQTASVGVGMSPVWNIIFSDNDTVFASGGDSLGEIRRVSDGALLRTLGSNRGAATSGAFSPDGAHYVVGNYVGGVELLRASDGAAERTVATHNAVVNSVAFSPDGARVASASGACFEAYDTRILITPLASGTAQLALPGHYGGTLSVAFSPDGSLLASGGCDDDVRIWRTSDGALLQELEGNEQPMPSVAFSPDGQFVAAGGGDSAVRLWRVSDWSLFRTIPGDGLPVGSIAFAPDGKTLALTTYNGVQLWRLPSGTLIRKLYAESGINNFGNVLFSDDGAAVGVANGSYPPTIRFWRTADGAQVKSYNRETGSVQPPALALSPDNALLGIARYDSVVEAAHIDFSGVASYAPAYEGEVASDCNRIQGWAWDSKQSDGVVVVDIYDGGTLLATVPANNFRQDLFNAGKGNGYHGFSLAVPASLKNGAPHTLSVKVSGTNVELTGSPQALTCGTPTTTPTPTPTPVSTPTPSPTPVLGIVTIQGNVVDKVSDAGAAGLTVTLSGDATATAQTDSRGHYSFANLPAGGAYTVMLSSPGWAASPYARTYLDCRTDKASDFEAIAETEGARPGSAPGPVEVSGGSCPGCNPGVGTNPVDDAEYFVAFHYLDFLGRGPDTSGLNFWQREIEQCGADAQCREVKRVNVSAAFFLSIEFDNTAYLAYRLGLASFGAAPRYKQLMSDSRALAAGVQVGKGDWEGGLAQNRRAFADAWVNRAEFKSKYGETTDEQYVAALLSNAGLGKSRWAPLVGALKAGSVSRADVLLSIADDAELKQKEKSRAFVLMQYYGYLRRDPDKEGYDYWLGKLDSFGGDFVRAEMVKAFLESDEYRRRFGR